MTKTLGEKLQELIKKLERFGKEMEIESFSKVSEIPLVDFVNYANIMVAPHKGNYDVVIKQTTQTLNIKYDEKRYELLRDEFHKLLDDIIRITQKCA